VVKSVERVKDSLKYLLVAGVVFEELGFTYLGPIDGHNIPRLKQVLTSALKVKGPVLVHVITTKGKGYPPAEAEPDRFHGIGPFDPATGKAKKKKAHPSYTEVFAETLVKLAERDHRIVGITAAMPMGTGLDRLARQFPNRCFDVGIAEQHAVTLAAGLATGGLKPVVAIYSTFLQRAYDQIVHDICLANLPRYWNELPGSFFNRHTVGNPSVASRSLWTHGFRFYFTPLTGVLFTVPSRYYALSVSKGV